MSDMMQPTNVGQQFSQGLGFGQQLMANKAQQDALRSQTMATQQQAQQDQEFYALLGKLDDPNATGADFRAAALRGNKDQSENIMNVLSSMETEQQQNMLSDSVKLYAALDSGNTELTLNELDRLISANKNSGDTEAVKQFSVIKDLIQTNPMGVEAAKKYIGGVASLFDGGVEAMDNAIARGKERRDQELHAGALKKQKLDADKLELEMNVKRAENNGVLSPENKRKAQTHIKDQFLSFNKSSLTALTKVDKVTSLVDRLAANEADGKKIEGVSDLAIINAFQRLIDDGVVKGEDVALQRNTGGALTKAMNTIASWTSGAVLSTEQRQEFKEVARVLAETEHNAVQRFKDTYASQIEKDGLDAEWIYGKSADGGTVAVTPVAVPSATQPVVAPTPQPVMASAPPVATVVQVIPTAEGEEEIEVWE